ncbi:hypothetical protein OCU04_000434 [Sclerotinia nivalis]|nr:hypothetical protein OCU04_000434 [Sclerotinia nivalis]
MNGPKILLIHGISTPCISLHSLATTLASSHGCRVLLFDLFGRGYSDGVSDLPHDERLYTAQILLVLTSSSLSWVGDGFNILGFSMGGGIAVDFAVAFPGMVKDVILLAPSGLIREEHFGWMGKAMRKWWFPDGLWGWILRRRVRGAYRVVSNLLSSLKDKRNEDQGQVDSELIMTIPASSPIANTDTRMSFDDTPISPSIPYTTIGQVMHWQTHQHHGYANAFASSIMYASVSGRGDTWRGLWGPWAPCHSSITQEKIKNSQREKILVVLGECDDVILAEELKEDLEEVVENIAVGVGGDGEGSMGFEERIVWKVVEGAGHEFPITRGEEVAGFIRRFLNM